MALLLVYGAVGFFFLARWARFRKAPSLYLALTGPLGWVLLASRDLGLAEPTSWAPARWLGVVVGFLMLNAVVRWDRKDPPRKED